MSLVLVVICRPLEAIGGHRRSLMGGPDVCSNGKHETKHLLLRRNLRIIPNKSRTASEHI